MAGRCPWRTLTTLEKLENVGMNAHLLANFNTAPPQLQFWDKEWSYLGLDDRGT